MAICSLSICLNVGLFAVYSPAAPCDEMFESFLDWSQPIALGSKPVPSDAVLPSLAVALMTSFSYYSVFFPASFCRAHFSTVDRLDSVAHCASSVIVCSVKQVQVPTFWCFLPFQHLLFSECVDAVLDTQSSLLQLCVVALWWCKTVQHYVDESCCIYLLSSSPPFSDSWLAGLCLRGHTGKLWILVVSAPFRRCSSCFVNLYFYVRTVLDPQRSNLRLELKKYPLAALFDISVGIQAAKVRHRSQPAQVPW